MLVGEMRDLETIRLALTAAETGHLVFGTLHTSSRRQDHRPYRRRVPGGRKGHGARHAVREPAGGDLPDAMKRVGGGRIAAHEIMIGTPAIRNLIREGKIAQMYSAIQTGQGQGMQTLDQCLQELVAKGVVEPRGSEVQGSEQGQHLMERDQAIRLMQDLLRRMVDKKGSDLFITAGFPPAIKVDGEIRPQSDRSLSAEQSAEPGARHHERPPDQGLRRHQGMQFRHRAARHRPLPRSAFVQQGYTGAVLRTINAKIPTLEELELPPILKEVVLSKRGFVIMVGGTGSGKSTSLAAMVGYRNEKTRGHIVTIEDPVEYVHAHKGCVVTQREVGVDCDSWHTALKNTLRQAPDVILIGEIRDRETMEYGIQFAETGHLVLATLHANSSNQALDRIINFFPEERREQLLMDLSLNIRALISQRLIPREAGAGRIAAMEIMLNSPLIADLIFKGEVPRSRTSCRARNRLGMKTFDQALFELYEAGLISYEDALRNADSKNELRLRVKLESKREMKNPEDGRPVAADRRGRRRPGVLRHVAAAPDAPGLAPVTQHQAAVQADGGEKGVGPFLHLQRAGQDQDRGQDLPGQQAGSDARDRAPGGLGLMTPGTDRAFQRGAARSISRFPSRASAASASTCSTSAAIPRWCCATSPPKCRELEDLGHARHLEGSGDAEARPDSHGGRRRRGQVHHARGDDQLPQRDLLGPHPHHRGSDRVPAHQQEVDRQSARGRASTPSPSPARCAARCARRRT